MKEKIKNALLKFYIRHLEKYEDGEVPKGHLKLFIFNDDFEIFEREEDKRYFRLSKSGCNNGTYSEVVIVDEYPEFSIYDTSFEDIDARCPSAQYRGKVEGEDRFVYFKLAISICPDSFGDFLHGTTIRQAEE